MSNPPKSWEDAAGDDEKLARQAEQLSLQQQQYQQPQQARAPFRPSFNAPTFNPGASQFQPGAASFTPGGYAPQYGQQGHTQPAYDYSQYGQAGVPGAGAGGYGGYNQYQQYPQYNQYQQPGQQFPPQQPGAYRPPHQQQQQFQNAQQSTPIIAKRPQQTTPAASPQAQPKPPVAPSPVAPSAPKVLKIGGSATPTPVKALGNAVLTIGGPPREAAKSAPTDKVEPAKAAPAAVAAKAVAGSAPVSGKATPAPTVAEKAAEKAAERAAEKREADAVLKAQEEIVDDATIEELYGKEHVNLIFIGHVDAGKSSLGGAILFATGMVDERTMDKYKQEAKAQGRETWYLSWALDLTKEERAKGKTVEVGRAYFETDKRRYTILDAPGHKTFVPSMIGGASQADVGVLVISARKGEYETGFEKGGQTREHAVLAKTQGVNKLVVVVNKMDDPTVEWSKERYDECTSKLATFLKGTGFNPKTDLMFMPLSAITGANLKERVKKEVCPWYSGPSLLEYLDSMKALERKVKAPFMMPVSGKYRDMGTVIEGKIESGIIRRGAQILLMPGKVPIEVLTIYSETEEEIAGATCGDQVRLRVKGVEEEDVFPGYVLTSLRTPVNCVSVFEAQIHIIDLKSILTAGFQCVMHVHTTIQEVTFTALLHKLEKGTGRKSRKPPAFAGKGQAIIARLEATTSFPLERYEDYQQLGRFTLRDQGQTIAIGKVTKLITDPAAVAV
ncbi:P-loop containing nucleoside triphosphate hydrolase protein [Peziza echinospora]|nr:P-loop containing nucleoside triphosphate hydrolase protein [Peziza echinospora]